MKIRILLVVMLFGLSCCSEPEEVSNEEYNQGRQRAEMEGCHCNADLPRPSTAPDDPKIGLSWADGYINACVRYKNDSGC